MQGNIIKISRFCTHDGPGIRTTVFLKGCPMNCIWCHNPESQKQNPQLWYDFKKCIICMKCFETCKYGCHYLENGIHKLNFEKCISCGSCATVCQTNAVELIGKTVTAQYVFDEVKKDVAFYKSSNGGVTISGGEPLMQWEFTSEILKLCKQNGIHTAIETSGFSGENELVEVLKYCDLVLFDIKETDENLHKKYTNVSLKPIIKNLNIINEAKIPVVVRMPIIPQLNDRQSHFEKVKKLVSDMEYCKNIEIMPYHSLGAYKYELLGKKYKCDNIKEPDSATKELWKNSI